MRKLPYMMSILDMPLYNEDGSLGKGAAVLKKNSKDDEVTIPLLPQNVGVSMPRSLK